MVNWWLVVVAVIVGLLTLGISTYIVFVLTTPSEMKKAIFPKIVAILGLTLAFGGILLLPYDTANRRDPTSVEDYGGGVDVVLLWKITLWSAGTMIVVVIPFAVFFYEAHDPEQYSFAQQCMPAFGYTCALMIFYLVLFLSLWYSVGYADIPFFGYSTPAQFIDPLNATLNYTSTKTVENLELATSPFVYTVGILCFFGWIFFVFYGGVGLTALPTGVVRALYKTPKRPLTKQELAAEEERIATEALSLIKSGQQLQKKSTSKMGVQRKINEFQASVRQLENQLKKARDSAKSKNLHYLKLALLGVFGIVAITLTVAWLFHIFFHNLSRTFLFLNAILVDMDDAFPLLGVLAYGVLVFYLLLCIVVGCVKVGLRFTCFTIHPLKFRDTRVNSILFNVGLILTTMMAVIQFALFSFKEYTVNTTVDMLFTVWVRRIRYFGEAFPYFQFAMAGVAFLSTTWIILCPRPKKKKKEDDDDDDD